MSVSNRSKNLLRIRRLRKSDIARYAVARKKLWPTHGIKEFRKELYGLLKNRHFFSWLAVTDSGDIVGLLEASLRPYANGCRYSPVLFLEGIWVDVKFRKRGIGYMLLGELEEFALVNAYKEIGSDCLFSNKLSVKVHKKWKFKETMRVVYFRKDLKFSRK